MYGLVLPVIVMCLHRDAMGPSPPKDSVMNANDMFRRHFDLVVEGLIAPLSPA